MDLCYRLVGVTAVSLEICFCALRRLTHGCLKTLDILLDTSLLRTLDPMQINTRPQTHEQCDSVMFLYLVVDFSLFLHLSIFLPHACCVCGAAPEAKPPAVFLTDECTGSSSGTQMDPLLYRRLFISCCDVSTLSDDLDRVKTQRQPLLLSRVDRKIRNGNLLTTNLKAKSRSNLSTSTTTVGSSKQRASAHEDHGSALKRGGT